MLLHEINNDKSLEHGIYSSSDLPCVYVLCNFRSK